MRPGDVRSAVPASGGYPRFDRGYALKRLEASEGPRRWVLQRSGVESLPADVRRRRRAVPAAGRPAARSPSSSARPSSGRAPTGPARLARLLSELAERGLLERRRRAPEAAPPELMQRLAAPRELTWAGAGALFERLYRRGGWRLFTPPALAAIAMLVLAGPRRLPLSRGRRATGRRSWWRRRSASAGWSSCSAGSAWWPCTRPPTGSTLASYGRRVRKAGLKLLLIFPYAYVDTSEAWFEPRRRRIAISAAGPGVRPVARRALRALLPGAARRGRCATSSSSSPLPRTSGRSST